MMNCEFCGGEVLMRDSRTGVCQICGRVYSGDTLRRIQMAGDMRAMQNMQNNQIPNKNKSQDLPPWAIVVLIMFCSGIVFGSGFAAFPLVPFIIFMSIAFGNKKKNNGRQNQQMMNQRMMNQPPMQQMNQPVMRSMPGAQPAMRSVRPGRPIPQMAVGERLETPIDYLEAFRILPLASMPFREEAGEAMDQLSSLITKQQGISSLLPPGHPYYPTVNDTIQFFLRNIKQILFRLRYCDQNDMSRREEHKAYFRSVLDENNDVLHDLETFMIELSQLDDGMQTAPCLDVLSQSMHSMRQPVPDEDEFMRQIAEHQAMMQLQQTQMQQMQQPPQDFTQMMQ